MAGAHSATASFLLHRVTTTTSSQTTHLSITTLPSISSILILSARRPRNRKNYLRPKILKTLTKPCTNPLLQQPPSQYPNVPILVPPEKDSKSSSIDQFPGDSRPAGVGEEDKEMKNQVLEHPGALEFSESIEIPGGKVGDFPENSFFKIGLWFVGAFVFQAICTFWVFGSADSGKKLKIEENKIESIGKSNSLEIHGGSGLNGYVNGKLRFKSTGNISTYTDEIQKKIQEIRLMAREARETEMLERKKSGLDGNESDFEDEEEDDFGKSGIEKEVVERLVKIRERLEKNHNKFPEVFGSNIREVTERQGKVQKSGVQVNPENEALAFKKKYKFKGSLSGQRDRPKGFTWLTEQGDNRVEANESDTGNIPQKGRSNLHGGFNMLDDDQRSNWDLLEDDVRSSSSKDTNWRQQGRGVDIAEPKRKKAQDRNIGKPLVDESSHENIMESSSRLKSRRQQKQSASSKRPSSETDWWSGLPYVLVILMEKGYNGDRQRGFYTLKSDSDTAGQLSHIIAFQDRGDATNFCYLLQIFFEDLADFSIDVVPLSIKELREAVKSNPKRALVVKRGQLQLYAGQPLSDVEDALRSLLEQT